MFEISISLWRFKISKKVEMFEITDEILFWFRFIFMFPLC